VFSKLKVVFPGAIKQPNQVKSKIAEAKSKIRAFVLSNFMVAAAAFVQNSFLYIRVFRKETIMAV
jgi:hypothetical protein